jgi:hypothetical protein
MTTLLYLVNSLSNLWIDICATHSDSICCERAKSQFKLSAANFHFHSLTNIQIHDLSTRLSEFLPPTPAPSPNVWVSPPPSYDDTIADLPPDYTTTDALATAQTPEYTPFPSLNPSICSSAPNCLRLSCDTSPSSSFYLDEKSLYAKIDLGFCEDAVRSHAKKKKGAAAKKNTFSWDDDEEKKKEEEAAGGSGGGDNGGGGGDPPADGGAGGGDGGGDGGDDKKDEDEWGAWDTGKKKKKKGKKGQEEEEERKRKEEEEEAERKKKEEEEAAAAAAATTGNNLSWADEVEAEAGGGAADDWGFSTAGKKKKGKKGKVRFVAPQSRLLNYTLQFANLTIGRRPRTSTTKGFCSCIWSRPRHYF